jgi:hypothetical protein
LRENDQKCADPWQQASENRDFSYKWAGKQPTKSALSSWGNGFRRWRIELGRVPEEDLQIVLEGIEDSVQQKQAPAAISLFFRHTGAEEKRRKEEVLIPPQSLLLQKQE